ASSPGWPPARPSPSTTMCASSWRATARGSSCGCAATKNSTPARSGCACSSASRPSSSPTRTAASRCTCSTTPRARCAFAPWYRDAAEGVRARFEGRAGPIWIGVHSAFGPLYIDQVGVGLTHDDTNGDGVDVMIDGSVRVSGLTVQVDELGVTVPFRYVLSPN